MTIIKKDADLKTRGELEERIRLIKEKKEKLCYQMLFLSGGLSNPKLDALDLRISILEIRLEGFNDEK